MRYPHRSSQLKVESCASFFFFFELKLKTIMLQELISYSTALSVAIAIVSKWTSSSLLRNQAYSAAKAMTCVWLAQTAYRLARYAIWRREMNRRFKGPPANFLLGNVSDLVAAGGFNEKFFQTLHDKYGEVARFWIFGDLNISVTNPSHANEIYKKCPTRPKETYMFLNYLGDENLLFQKDPVVVKQLRLKYNRMVSNQEALRKVTLVAQDMFQSRGHDWLDEKGVDIHKMTGPLIYDIMGRVLFGGEWSKSEIGKEIRKNHVYLIENSNVWAFYPFKPWYNSAYRKYASTIKILRQLAGSLVDQRRRDVENDKTGQEAKRNDAVTMLVTERREDGTITRPCHRTRENH